MWLLHASLIFFKASVGFVWKAEGDGGITYWRPVVVKWSQVRAGVASVTVEDLQFLADLAATGAYTPVIDRSYPLENAAEDPIVEWLASQS